MTDCTEQHPAEPDNHTAREGQKDMTTETQS
jgi:hypothetical protein